MVMSKMGMTVLNGNTSEVVSDVDIILLSFLTEVLDKEEAVQVAKDFAEFLSLIVNCDYDKEKVRAELEKEVKKLGYEK